MPMAVRGLSSGSSRSSAAPPANTSSSQDSKREESTQRPAKRSKQDRRLAPGGMEETFELKEDDNLTGGDSMHDLPKWLEEFTEYLVDWEASTPD